MRRWLLCHARLSGFGCEKARAEKRSWFVLCNKKQTMNNFLLDGMIRLVALLLLLLEIESSKKGTYLLSNVGRLWHGMYVAWHGSHGS